MTKKADFPCSGCITVLPDAAATPAPILVVLHGDGGAPASMVTVWEKAAIARGVVLFAPKCPVDDGCTNGSWWQWGKDPSWLDARLDAIAAVQPIDRAHVYAAGWSGGASWLGWRAPDLVGRFAAVSIDGGGMMPHTQTCTKTCSFDAHFLVGDKNPLHSLTEDLRAWLQGCATGETRWDLLAGADHGGEWKALNKKGEPDAILDWFLTKTMTCAPAVTDASPSDATAAGDASLPGDGSVNTVYTTSPPTHPAPPQPMPAARCACDIVGSSLVLAIVVLRTRRRR